VRLRASSGVRRSKARRRERFMGAKRIRNPRKEDSGKRGKSFLGV
jgi:hypothetical protein